MTYARPTVSPRLNRSVVSISPTFVREIAVVGPGLIGLPMAAMLANAELWAPDGTPARVTVVQRASRSSGWKVGAINAGRSPIGRLEPAVDELVAQGAGSGRLRATTEYRDIRNADVVLVCVQTNRHAMGPDYDALREALHGVADSLAQRSVNVMPLVVIESTLAPSTMLTMVRDLFAQHDLLDGRDLLLANSPSRAMSGHVVDRLAGSDKLIGALSPASAHQVASVYDRIVHTGALHCTNSMTAEVVKTLENASRDVRIAYAAEVVRYCDAHDVDFFAVRRLTNARLAQERGTSEASSSGLLVPTVGVGGHGLPKDGILMWWRALEQGINPAHSLLLEARRINDEAPAQVVALTERFSGSVRNREIALLGVAYRADTSDARNSPTLTLARHLMDRGANVRLHDPHVSAADPTLLHAGMGGHFHRDLADALVSAEVVIVCVAHREYLAGGERWLPHAQRLRTVIDACHAYRASEMATTVVRYGGIGRGIRKPSGAYIDAVVSGLGAIAQGVANEAQMLVDLLNERFATDEFNSVDFGEVRRLAATCAMGCDLPAPGPIPAVKSFEGFRSRLVACACAVVR
jgi:UDP-N-acetyl-D-mannosaminuronic acid dehydrogenase